MASYEFVTVDVFTDTRFGGNPLAVFPDARGLDEALMQRLATEFNLSETTFVLPPENAGNDARVRIFTPTSELPFAGHPNVGTAYVLATRGGDGIASFRFEEPAGLVEVTVRRDGAGAPTGALIAAPQPLTLFDRIDADLIAACAGLDTAEIATRRHAPVIAGMGAPFVFAELGSNAALARAVPDVGAFRAARQRHPDRFALALYWRDPAKPEHLRMRMFAPLEGIMEDPATGSAAVALAGLLLSLERDRGEAHYRVDQGAEMGRPSRLDAAATRDHAGAIRGTVAGNCVPVLSGRATV